MAEWLIAVDGERCLGSGLCVAAAPDRFQLVDGESEPVAARISPDPAVVAAAELCPVEAITVERGPA